MRSKRSYTIDQMQLIALVLVEFNLLRQFTDLGKCEADASSWQQPQTVLLENYSDRKQLYSCRIHRENHGLISIYLFIQQHDLFEYLKSRTTRVPWRQRISFFVLPFLFFVVCLCVCMCLILYFLLWYSRKILVISSAVLHRFFLPL